MFLCTKVSRAARSKILLCTKVSRAVWSKTFLCSKLSRKATILDHKMKKSAIWTLENKVFCGHFCMTFNENCKNTILVKIGVSSRREHDFPGIFPGSVKSKIGEISKKTECQFGCQKWCPPKMVKHGLGKHFRCPRIDLKIDFCCGAFNTALNAT